MKVYTITCHDVYNHGASLQAYALMKYLRECGHNVEIIDYKPDYLNNHYKLFSVDNPKWGGNALVKLIYLIIKLPARLRGLQRKGAFDKFTSKYLRITDTTYLSNEELKEKLPLADAYICGSDQIWNSYFENGKDPAFYLDFAPGEKKKVSYAASFATDTIANEVIPMVHKSVKRLDRISVREKSGVKILNDMNIPNAVNVVDPTLLLSKEEWNKIGKRKFESNYILIYDFDNNDTIKKLAIDIAKEKGYEIYSINPGKVNYADKYFKYAGPDTFIPLIRDADFVISNSFHAAVFSVIFQKNFAIVNRNENINTRMRDFLRTLKLEERLVHKNYNLEALLNQINYKETEKILSEEITLSKHFLNESLLIEEEVKDVL